LNFLLPSASVLLFPRQRKGGWRARKFMYYQLRSVYETIELGMHRAKKKPLTKKERAEKRKKRKEKRAAKRAIP
jgi:hypothetical protein